MTVEGHIENGRIVLNPQVVLPEGMKVRVELVLDQEATEKVEAGSGALLEHYRSVIGAVGDLPADFAAQHDHYIHGIPKK